MTAKGPDWRARRLGAGWQFGFFRRLLALAGRPSAYFCSDVVSLYYVLARRAVRERSRPYLSHRFPTRTGLRRLLDTWRLTRAFARLLVDRAALRLPGDGGLTTTFSGRATLESLLSEGKGLLLVTAHAGAWQLGLRNLGRLDVPLGILTRHEEGDLTHPFAAEGGGPSVQLIDPEGFLGGVPDMLGLLYRGGMVCIMGDRALGGQDSTVAARFLGDPAPIPFSPYLLASATGAPVVVLFPYKPDRDRYEVVLADVIRVPPDLGRDPEAYRPFAERFAHALEGFVDAFPYQFFNFYNMWTPPVPPHEAAPPA